MGRKIDEAFYRLSVEANHHIRLSQTKQEDYENGFAQGFVEALRIVGNIRNQKVPTKTRNLFPEGMLIVSHTDTKPRRFSKKK